MSKLTRRLFITGAATAVVAGSYVGYKLVWGTPEEIVVAILERRLGHLRVDSSSFETFASAYVEHKHEVQGKLKKLSVISGPYQYSTAYDLVPMGHALRRMEDNVVGRYLMSTDFFEHGADESREIRYVAFYDPALTPCRNFLARPMRG